MERLRQIKGETDNERALYARMHLLQGIVAFHQGKRLLAESKLKEAEVELRDLIVSDDLIEEVVAFGYGKREALLALRACGLNVARAASYVENKRKERERLEKEERERDAKRRKYGRTVEGNYVNIGFVNTLVTRGFGEDFAVEALRQTDNDMDNSIKLMQEQPDLIFAAVESAVEEREAKRRREDEDESAGPSTSKEAKKKLEEEKQAALKRLKKDIGKDNFGDTDTYLDLNLKEEKYYLTKYLKFLEQ